MFYTIAESRIRIALSIDSFDASELAWTSAEVAPL
jgi:hypothetical protein